MHFEHRPPQPRDAEPLPERRPEERRQQDDGDHRRRGRLRQRQRRRDRRRRQQPAQEWARAGLLESEKERVQTEEQRVVRVNVINYSLFCLQRRVHADFITVHFGIVYDCYLPGWAAIRRSHLLHFLSQHKSKLQYFTRMQPEVPSKKQPIMVIILECNILPRSRVICEPI